MRALYTSALICLGCIMVWRIANVIIVVLIIFALLTYKPTSSETTDYLHTATYPPTHLQFIPKTLSVDQSKPPVICNIQFAKLGNNKNSAFLICDAQNHAVSLGKYKDNQWYEDTIANDIQAPARCYQTDFDNDGDIDILVANLGSIFPTDKLVGEVILLENTENSFTKHILLDKLRRVADVRCHDFDNDGDQDLVVAIFGHGHGSLLYCEQASDNSFKRTQLLDGPGFIHAPIADFDNDGFIDIASVISQDEEEVWVHYGTGKGTFQKSLLFSTLDNEFGSSGLIANDIDNDGDVDLLLTNGDNLEEFFHYPQQNHGATLFINNKHRQFSIKRISSLPGCYAADIKDLNNDGLKDIVLLSMVNNWKDHDSASVIILEQSVNGDFSERQLASKPIKLISCCIDDLNNDGQMDILAGGFRIQPPFSGPTRLQAWIQE